MTLDRNTSYPALKPGRIAHGIAVAVYLLAAVWLTWPLARDARTMSYVFGGDTALNTYAIAWGQHALLHDPSNVFEASMLHPSPRTLALSENLLGVAVAALPLRVFDNPILTYNVVFLIGMFISAWAWFGVLSKWRFPIAVALAGGFYFGFMPWRFGQLGHGQLQFTWWIPAAVALAESWARRRGLKQMLLLGAVLAASVYTCVYHTVFLVQFLIPFTLAGILLGGKPPEWRSRIPECAAGAVLFGVLVAPAALAYADMRDTLNNPTNLEQAARMSSEIMDYLRPPPNSLLWSGVRIPPPRADALTPWEQYSFPGLACLIMAAMGAAASLRKRRECAENPNPDGIECGSRGRLAIMFLAGGAWLLLLSFGPWLHLGGQRTGFPMPFAVLFKLFPGMESIRVPSRAAFMVSFALGGLAAAGFEACWTAPARIFRIAGRVAVFAIGALMLLESVHNAPPPSSSPQFERHESVQRRIAEERRGSVLVLPLDPALNFIVPLATHPHLYPTLNGLSGHLPPTNFRIFQILGERHWNGEQAEVLKGLCVRHLLVDQLGRDAPPADQIETFLQSQGFAFRRIEFAVEHITYFKIDPYWGEFPLSARIAREDKKTEVQIAIAKQGGIMEMRGRARELKISLRGEDAEGDTTWKSAETAVLPAWWIPGQTVVRQIPISASRARKTAKIKLRIEIEEIGVKEERELAL